MEGGTLQSIVFMVDKGWTTHLARKWLEKHNKKPIKAVDKKYKQGRLSQLRYRISEPVYSEYMTKKTPIGINFVIGLKQD